MSIEMVLNELSLQTAPDIYIARQWMSTLIETIKAATSQRISRVLRTRTGISGMNLAENYPLSCWLNDPEVDRDATRYIRSAITKGPLWNGFPDVCDELGEREFRCYNCVVEGLGVAYLLDYLAISLLSEDLWDYESLTLCVSTLEDDGGIEESEVYVNHASQARHLEQHTRWIVNRLQSDIQNGMDLWNRRNELFPSIVFCESVAEQIQDLTSIMIRHVFRNLLDLENYCSEWTNGPFSRASLRNVTPDSQVTLDRYPSERTFLCPDGERRVFSWHIRIPDAWRIYFEPISETRQIIVGYVGHHLRTVRHHH